MFFASEKEYELLKKETAEIRDCITKYVGYIIGVTAISSAALKYWMGRSGAEQSKEQSIAILFAAASMIVLTLLFEVIWYKFKSHNRHIGYLTLLSQEMQHYQLPMDTEVENTKAYLHEDVLHEISTDAFSPKNIFAWEFVMARFDSAQFENSGGKISNALRKLRFVFTIPKRHNYQNMWHDESYKTLDLDFFNAVISKIYVTPGPQSSLIQKFMFFLKELLNPFFYLKTLNSFSIFFLNDKKWPFVWRENIDSKYISGGWSYPTKVTQISIVSVTLLFILINYLYMGMPHEDSVSLFAYIASVFTFFLWVYRYLLGLHDIKGGIHSIDYYCWTFFLYRVQILNSRGILPKYFSRGFIRFYKSRLILQILHKYKDECIHAGNTRYINLLRDCLPFDPEMRQIHTEVLAFVRTKNY